MSFQTTEKEDNYDQQIIWQDKEEGNFEKIIMRSSSSLDDSVKESDIQAARNTMEEKYPIGIFENMSKGKNRCLGLGVITEETEEGNFIIEPIIVESKDIMNKISKKRKYFSFRTKKEETVKAVLNGEKKIEFDGIYTYLDPTN